MDKTNIKNKGTIELKTDRLILRKFRLKDYKDMYNNYLSKESCYTYLGGKPIKSKLSAYFICLVNIANNRRNTNYNWGVEYGGQVVGAIAVNYIDKSTKNCSIGYTIGEAFWKKGIAAEAVKAVINFLFIAVGVHKISARHYSENVASGKVMEKSGMHIEAVFKDEYFKHDRYYDSVMYSIFKESVSIAES